MSKGSKIKWRNKDLGELERVVKNYNAKINRVAKKNPDAKEYLPEKVSIKELKSGIVSRRDFNRELNKLSRFSRKGAENIQTTPSGLTLTKYEIQETKRMVGIVNAKRARERDKLDISVQKGNMGQVSQRGLEPKKFNLNKSAKEWKAFVESLEKEISSGYTQKQMERYKENYLKAIREGLNAENSKLYKMIQKMDAKTLFENSVNNPILSIDFKYDPLDADVKYEAVLEAWESLE